jgi:hypothetical protein
VLLWKNLGNEIAGALFFARIPAQYPPLACLHLIWTNIIKGLMPKEADVIAFFPAFTSQIFWQLHNTGPPQFDLLRI